jgi:hypothetical protein
MAIVASTGDADLAAGATTETVAALPGAEDSVVESAMVTPVEAEMPTAALVALVADAASTVVAVPIVAVDAASTVAAAPIVVAADVASAVVDVPLVVAVDAPSVEGGMVEAEAEVEAVPTVVGAGRLHH